jgi:hypothetical protein
MSVQQQSIPRRTTFFLSLLVLVTLILPGLVFSQFNSAAVGSLIGLIGLGTLVATLVHGAKVGMAGTLVMAFMSGLAYLSSTNPIYGIPFMVTAAIIIGLSARVGWQTSFTLYAISLAFIVSGKPSEVSLDVAALLSLCILGTGVFVIMAATLIMKSSNITVPNSSMNWSRTLAFTVLLSVTQLAAASIALLNDWGHTGGWLMMTPFIVIQPYLHDGWMKALRRAAGTIAGFTIAVLLGNLITSTTILAVIGGVFALLAAEAFVKRANYTLYVSLLTPAVVILESVGRPVSQIAEYRLVATILGIGLSLIAMAVAIPIYRYGQKAGSNHS